jgi:hypothetical protein
MDIVCGSTGDHEHGKKIRPQPNRYEAKLNRAGANVNKIPVNYLGTPVQRRGIRGKFKAPLKAKVI